MGTAIIGAIAVALFILPFILIGRIQKRQKKHMLRSLSELAAKHNGKITRHEFCADFVMGLDENAGLLFFLKRTNAKETSRVINLGEIRSCRVVSTGRSSGGHKVPDKLELAFLPLTANGPELLLEIYDVEERMQLTGELQFVEKWVKIINEQLIAERTPVQSR